MVRADAYVAIVEDNQWVLRMLSCHDRNTHAGDLRVFTIAVESRYVAMYICGRLRKGGVATRVYQLRLMRKGD